MHPLETAAEAVWARERAGCSDKKKLLRLGARPSESSPLTLHHSLIKNTQFEKKQETIFEKDVITSQFTLPALCYGVCVCLCLCMCVDWGHKRVLKADQEHSLTTFNGESLSTKTVLYVCVFMCVFF